MARDFRPHSHLMQEYGSCGRSGSRRKTCRLLIGAGERRLGVSVSGVEQGQTARPANLRSLFKVEVDASASLLKKYLKHRLGLEVVGEGQRAALWAGVI